MNLAENSISTLANDSFDSYPNLKRLQLAANKVHTIDSAALADLAELEWLDLSDNSITEAPAGLPASLQELILNRNPVSADMRALAAAAAGLHTLRLQWSADDATHGLSAYPEFDPMPGLVALDVSLNRRIRDVAPRQLAATCRLARLNVTGTALFPAGAHCRCRRFVDWTAEYKIAVTGLGACPEPGGGGVGSNPEDDDPNNENCTRTPDDAHAVYRACMKRWDRINSSFWSVAAGLTVAAVVVAALLCVCVRRRRRRGRGHGDGGGGGRADNGKPLPVPSADGAKDNDNLQPAAAAGPGGHKSAAEPAALLS